MWTHNDCEFLHKLLLKAIQAHSNDLWNKCKQFSMISDFQWFTFDKNRRETNERFVSSRRDTAEIMLWQIDDWRLQIWQQHKIMLNHTKVNIRHTNKYPILILYTCCIVTNFVACHVDWVVIFCFVCALFSLGKSGLMHKQKKNPHWTIWKTALWSYKTR